MVAPGVESIQCIQLAASVVERVDRGNGVISKYILSDWCEKFCPGWTPFRLEDIALVIFQFIIPVIIFSLGVPRRWHFDLPNPFFDTRGRWALVLVRLIVSFFVGGFVATCDMILWITCIMSIAGPALFSAVQEAMIDHLVVTNLPKTRPGSTVFVLSRTERAELITTVLCGNFDIDGFRARARIHRALLPDPSMQWTIDGIRSTQSRLNSISNSQTAFGLGVGIPGLFFLGGFLYNALSIKFESATGINWVPFAIFWLVLLLVAVVSATLLAGNNPAAVFVLIATGVDEPSPAPTWWVFLKDYYDGELHPVSIWARGHTKRKWLDASAAVQNHAWLKDSVAITPLKWTFITITSLIFLLFPTAMAYSWAYYVTAPRMGCRTLTYAVYMASQSYLTLITLYLSVTRQSYLEILAQRPWRETKYQMLPGVAPQTVKQSASTRLLHTLAWSTFLVCFPILAVIGSGIVILPGSIFQIFGVYNNCLCQTDVRTWHLPKSQRLTWIGNELSLGAVARLEGSTTGMTWACVAIVGVVVYAAWWYQRVLRASVGRMVMSLDKS